MLYQFEWNAGKTRFYQGDDLFAADLPFNSDGIE
jgi:hypothetical protein